MGVWPTAGMACNTTNTLRNQPLVYRSKKPEQSLSSHITDPRGSLDIPDLERVNCNMT